MKNRIYGRALGDKAEVACNTNIWEILPVIEIFKSSVPFHDEDGFGRSHKTTLRVAWLCFSLFVDLRHRLERIKKENNG